MINANPADWTYLSFYYCGISADAAEGCSEDNAATEEALETHKRHPEAKSLKHLAHDYPAGATGWELVTGCCDHCGVSHAWGAVFKNIHDGTVLAVGHKCAKMFNLPDITAKKRRRAEQFAAASRARRATLARNLRAVVCLCRECPAVRAWWRSTSSFARDLRSKADQYSFSARQLAAIKEAAVRAAAREADPTCARAVLQPASPAPIGRWTGALQLLSWKEKDTEFGIVTKGLFQHPTDGWKVWMTAPSGLKLENGAVAVVSVTCEPKKDDPTFAWGSRPTLKKV